MADEVSAGKIGVELTADTTPLQRGLKQAAEQLKTFGDQSKATGKSFDKLSGTLGDSVSQFTKMGRALGLPVEGLSNIAERTATVSESFAGLSTGMAIAGGAVAAVGIATVIAGKELASMTLDIAHQVEEQEHLAQRTGISVKAQQEWSVAMALVGLQSGSLTVAMRVLSKNILDSRDASTDSARTFRALGITSTNTEQVIRDLADSFAAMPDGAQKSRLAIQLLGRSGLELIPILNKGSAALDESAKQAREFGLVLNDSQVKSLTAVDDAWDKVGVAMQGFKTQIAVLVAGPLKSFLDWTTESIANLTKMIGLLEHTSDLMSFKKMDLPAMPFGPPSPGGTKTVPLPPGIVQSQMAEALMPGPSGAQAPGELATQFAKSTESLNVFLGRMKELSKQGLITQDEIGAAIVAHTQMWDNDTEHARKLAQELLGAFKTNQFVRDYKELQAASALWAKSDFEGTSRDIAQFKALETQMRATATAGNQAALAGGRITPVTFEQRSSALAMETITQEIQGQQQLLKAIQDRFAKELQLAQLDSTEQRKLIQQNLAEVATANNQIAVLEEQRRTAGIAGSAAETQAYQQMYQKDLAASAQTANAEVAILEAQYAASSDLRQAKLDAIDASEQRELAVVGLTQKQIVAIETGAMAERMSLAQQYPAFWQKQLKTLVDSNTFSMGLIVNAWTSGIANSIVKGGDFAQAAWQATQVAIIQGALNTTIALMAEFALRSSAETAWALLASTNVTGINVAKNSAIVGSDAAAASTSVSIWAGATEAIWGMMVATGAAIKAFMVETILPMLIKVGEIVMSVMSAIAEAMMDTIFGIPQGLLLLGAVVALGVALAAAGAVKFAKGGIATGPTLGMLGEAGSAEAAIPLNERGAKFMQQTMGLGSKAANGGTQTTIVPVYLNGREIARATNESLPSEWRRMGLIG